MGTIDDFATNFGQGQRVSQFRVTGKFIGAGGNSSNSEDDQVQFFVKSAQFPSSNIGIIEVPYRGRKIKMPGDRVFNEWSISVLLDQENKMYDKFVAWMDALNSHSNVSSSGAVGAELKETWTVTSLAANGDPNSSVQLKNCFPTEVGTVDFNYETTDTIAEFSVTMHFDYWEKTNVTT